MDRPIELDDKLKSLVLFVGSLVSFEAIIPNVKVVMKFNKRLAYKGPFLDDPEQILKFILIKFDAFNCDFTANIDPDPEALFHEPE